jgi:hypothetical protein
MISDPRLQHIEIEEVPWTPETWNYHVNAVAGLLAELEEKREARLGSHGPRCSPYHIWNVSS